MTRINYEMMIEIPTDDMKIIFSGEKVEFKGIVRPRHLKIVSTIVDLMRDYRKTLPDNTTQTEEKDNG